ncbi:MAG TPA: patatin-like phospholipase family protein [Thermoanaerobaculia bacterium]|nr:patatin-like phospholipase family protein [Thermoanaerobaculia bacterium]
MDAAGLRDDHRKLWGKLSERYLDPDRPHRLLALDGGGIRGLLTLEVLARMESLLAEATGRGKDFRLCDFFDYIAGTSTGAIMAAGLARGMSVAELLDFYRKTGPDMFDKAFILYRVKYLYKSQPLEEKLKEVFGADTDLSPEHLRCLLLVVTRNVTTDSPWPISSNPLAMFNLPELSDCNLRIPLWQLVRASTAAPIFFAPEILRWDANDPSKHFVFVDGGMTPYNDPAFLLFRMATHEAYRLGWKTGERNLLLVSVGTGAAPAVESELYSSKDAVSNLVGIPSALMYGSQVDQDVNCRTIGRCTYGEPIDVELGDMIPRGQDGNPIPLDRDLGRAFLYARYNVELTSKKLNEWGLGDVDPAAVSKLDSVQHLDDLSRVGKRLAEEVKLEHFGPFVTI